MESLKEVIDFCKSYGKIIVLGPQRSGTTIASTILSHELGYQQVREEQIKIRSLHLLYKDFLLNKKRFVLQAPGLTSVCHFIDHPRLAIVFMRRNTGDILSSQERIMWNLVDHNLKHYFRDSGEIAKVRYQCWEKYQKGLMRSAWVEMRYDSMKDHPFWVNSGERTDFKSRQVRKKKK